MFYLAAMLPRIKVSQTFIRQIRRSSSDSRLRAAQTITPAATKAIVPPKERNDREICLNYPLDKRAPFPGNIGPRFTQTSSANKIAEIPETLQPYNQLFINTLDCQVIDCPVILKQEIFNKYPLFVLPHLQLTALVFSQRTCNDMAIWSEDMDLELDYYTKMFKVVSLKVTLELAMAGYWAKDLDPLLSDVKFENNLQPNISLGQNYKKFDFQVEDLGCCKIIKHDQWGTHAFVGTIFTNAHPDEIKLQEICGRYASNEI